MTAHMPTYDELANDLRTLVQATHAVFGSVELKFTRETSDLLMAMKQAHDDLAKLEPPENPPTEDESYRAYAKDDSSVIHLYGSDGN